MAVMFRTPDILDDITRTTHYNEEDVYQEETLEVQTNEVKLIKELANMVDNNIPLSQTQLMRRTGVGEGMLTHYDFIFNDLIEMLGLFYPVEKNSKVKESPKYIEAKALLDKDDIHSFEALEAKVLKEIKDLILGADDNFAVLIEDLYDSGMVNKIFHEKALEPAQAMFSFLGQRYIHRNFVSLDINGMEKLVFEKYKRVQELKAEYNRLKAEQ